MRGEDSVGEFSREGHNKGCHEKAPVHCLDIRLAALRGHDVVVVATDMCG